MAEDTVFTVSSDQNSKNAIKFNVDTIKSEIKTEEVELVECYNETQFANKTEDGFDFDGEPVRVKDEPFGSQLGVGHQLNPKESEKSVKNLQQCNNKTELTEKLKQYNCVPMVIIYECNVCSYKTKYKEHLDKHMGIHQDDFQIGVRQCELCSFQTKHKSSFIDHMLIHKSASEITMYACNLCTYKTKRKRCLKLHALLHKDASQLTMYECEVCEYRSKRKDYLKCHMLSHQHTSSATMHQCKVCEFKTKYKRSLKKHMISHEKIAP